MSSNFSEAVGLRSMHRRALLRGAAAAMIGTCLPGCAFRLGAGARSSSRLEAVAADAAMGKVPGLAVLEVVGARIAGESVWGVRDAGTGQAVSPGDLWHLGSNGKPITAALIARLVERRLLSWNDRLQDLLPNLRPWMRPEFRQSTLLELVTHRSGLATNGELPVIAGFYNDARPLSEQRLDYLKHALGQAPAGPRGAYHYSNTAFIAAGAAAEQATGLAFEKLIRKEIFEPLKMGSVGFGPTPIGQPRGHADGIALLPPRGDNPNMWAPAGGMHMSLPDWAKFAIDQMKGRRGEGRLLKTQAYAFLQTAPEGQLSAVDWGVQTRPYGPLLIHTGSNGAWYALTALAPDPLNAVIVATNADNPDAEAVTGRAFDRITASWAHEAG